MMMIIITIIVVVVVAGVVAGVVVASLFWCVSCCGYGSGQGPGICITTYVMAWSNSLWDSTHQPAEIRRRLQSVRRSPRLACLTWALLLLKNNHQVMVNHDEAITKNHSKPSLNHDYSNQKKMYVKEVKSCWKKSCWPLLDIFVACYKSWQDHC